MIRLPSDLHAAVLAGGTLVVPSRQRAHAARLAFAATQLDSGARVWATPDVLTLEAWLIREAEQHASVSGSRLPRILSPAEDWLLWRQCTAEATQDLELLSRGALAESLRRASALAVEFGIDLSALPPLAGAEAALLNKTQRAVDDRCRALGAANIQSLVAKLPSVNAPGAVTFAGFLPVPSRLQTPGAAFRSTSSELSRPRVAIAADESDELESIAQWCRRQIASKQDSRLLVVLPGSTGARERLATLIRQALDPQAWLSPGEPGIHAGQLVLIEGGGALADVPVVAHALSTLRWLGGSDGEFEQVSEWLRAPYWDAPSAGLRARMDLWLRDSGQTTINGREWGAILSTAPSPIVEGARELARQITAGVQALGGGVVSPREWSERFRAALNAVNWPGERVRDSNEQQTVVRLHELLDEFGQLASSAHAMSRDEAVHWFGELASQTAFRPADDDAVVTISAAFADPIVLYDGIWVAGLHAEAFPQPLQPDPFLPISTQIAAGIPAASAAGRLAEARALLGAWRAATSELVLSAPARADDLELLPSPLFAQWVEASASGAARARDELTWLPQLVHRPDMLESLEDTVGVPWPAGPMLPAGTRSLELQNLCAFRAYAELRLGSTEMGAPEPGIAPDVRGQLLHAALQILWRQLRDSDALAEHAEPRLVALIERSVAEAADSILGGAIGGERPPLFARECRRTIRLIGKLCELERSRHPFRVQDTEFEKTLTVSGAQLKVRIDRLDALDGGGRAILDYKSGRRTAADWYGERPSHPQLLAYLAAIGEDVAAMATVNVTAREVRFEGVAHSSHLLPKVKQVEGPGGEFSGDAWQLRTREWLACIERLASEFLAGRASVDPKPGACDYCHAVGICRISDRGMDVVAELLNEEFERNGD